jgi:non-heme chloroperoxidase
MPIQPADRFVKANQLNFHYLDWGSTDKPPLVLLHGMGQTCHTWDFFAEAMSPHFHVMAFDQRGHGDSDWAHDRDYSRTAMVGDVAAFTHALGLERFLLAGMSMGGMNSICFAAEHAQRVEALIVVDIGPRIEKEGVRHIRDFMSNHREFVDLDEAAAIIHRFNPRRPLEAVRNFTCVYNLKQLPSGRWTWKYDSYFSDAHRVPDARMHDQLAEAARRVRCPTLLVKGAESDVFSLEGAREFQTLIPDAEFSLVPGAGHSVMGDNPAGFETAVRQFCLTKGYL